MNIRPNKESPNRNGFMKKPIKLQILRSTSTTELIGKNEKSQHSTHKGWIFFDCVKETILHIIIFIEFQEELCTSITYYSRSAGH